MNRNVESHFSLLPNMNIQRSKLDMSKRRLTSFNIGDVVPVYFEDILPGDTFQVDSSKVLRMQTLLTPMMDNIYVDTYFFFVPSRLCWTHWKEFMGENTESEWIPSTQYTEPQIEPPIGGWDVGTIADYLGIPTGVDNISVSALPFRAVALCMNEWFRDQNLSDPLVIPLGDATQSGSNGSSYITDVANGGKPFVAAKYHDYFTSALPGPQKGQPVSVDVIAADTKLPVFSANEDHAISYSQDTASPLRFFKGNGTATTGLMGVWNGNTKTSISQAGESSDVSLYPVNLFAYPSAASVVDINTLRTAFQIQKFLEKDARGGTRYTELIRSHFSVQSPDARLQRPEYLGGKRIPITISQVVQQSGTESTGTPQGNVAAYSLTTDRSSDFTKSFTEHGYIIGFAVARYDHTYQQGIRRAFSRKSRYDYYWPVFANLGERAILNKEIFAQGTSDDEDVFGYQEAWAEYRYGINEVTGEMRSQYAQSLDVWHLADDYSSQPYLSDSWIREDKSTVDRVLAVSSSVSNQIFGDFYFKVYATRPMPVYSIPGLVDHH